jgi:DNA-binding transcriptional regulator GbsR (MarR family)
MGLKELQSWSLVRLKHFQGDRRDYFTTPEDLWEIVRILVAERKEARDRPDADEAARVGDAGPAGDDYAEARIAELRELIEMMTGFYDEMEKLETERLVKLMTMGKRIVGLIDKAGGARCPSLTKRK